MARTSAPGDEEGYEPTHHEDQICLPFDPQAATRGGGTIAHSGSPNDMNPKNITRTYSEQEKNSLISFCQPSRAGSDNLWRQ